MKRSSKSKPTIVLMSLIVLSLGTVLAIARAEADGADKTGFREVLVGFIECRVYDGECSGEFFAGLMVVGYYKVESELGGELSGVESGDAAVDGYYKGGCFFCDGFYCVLVQAITFVDTVRDVIVDVCV